MGKFREIWVKEEGVGDETLGNDRSQRKPTRRVFLAANGLPVRVYAALTFIPGCRAVGLTQPSAFLSESRKDAPLPIPLGVWPK